MSDTIEEGDDQQLEDDDRQLTIVDEALVAGNIANTNGLLVILARLVAKGVFDADDLHAFSDSYSKPLDHENMRENELITQMQDQMEVDARAADALSGRQGFLRNFRRSRFQADLRSARRRMPDHA